MDAQELPTLGDSFRHASDEMLAAILDQSADCIKVIGPTGSLDYMNRNGRCAMEIDDFALIAGKDWWDLWPEEAQPRIREAVQRAQSGQESRFTAFCPTAKGSPRWWNVSVSPLRDQQGRLQGLISVSRDVTSDMAARELRESTAAEMRHRLQNAYTLTSAIVMATARGRPEHQPFAMEIVERLQHLGVAQSLLLDGERLDGTNLDKLVRKLTEPFCGDATVLEIGCLPDVVLDETRARSLALVLGELSTNSNKYGALGYGGGVAIEGEIAEGLLRLRWEERSIHPVQAGTGNGGTGLNLIQRTLAAQGGTIDTQWHDQGLKIVVTLPGF